MSSIMRVYLIGPPVTHPGRIEEVVSSTLGRVLDRGISIDRIEGMVGPITFKTPWVKDMSKSSGRRSSMQVVGLWSMSVTCSGYAYPVKFFSGGV